MEGVCTIVVDRRAYEVEASEGTMCVRYGDLVLELPRWSAAQHLDALHRHLVPGPAGVELDGEGYAAEVLARTEAPVERWGELVPLALWWATRPELDATLNDEASTELHDGARAWLRDCTWLERVAAARRGLTKFEGGLAIDPVRVMEHLLEQVVERIEGPDGRARALDEIAGSSLVRLANVVLERNSREAPFSELGELEEAPEQARGLLELCRALGRSPSEVLALPAAEVDIVRELLRRVEPTKASARPVTTRAHAPLHDAPDAIVIDFGGGGAT
jgi:hypothetical protein